MFDCWPYLKPVHCKRIRLPALCCSFTKLNHKIMFSTQFFIDSCPHLLCFIPKSNQSSNHKITNYRFIPLPTPNRLYSRYSWYFHSNLEILSLKSLNQCSTRFDSVSTAISVFRWSFRSSLDDSRPCIKRRSRHDGPRSQTRCYFMSQLSISRRVKSFGARVNSFLCNSAIKVIGKSVRLKATAQVFS